MQTPSHFLITAFLGERGGRTLSVPLHWSALLVGSVLPDIPFALLTVAGEAWFLWLRPLPGVGKGATMMEIMEYLHFDRFFNDPLWIVSHNFFHSLVLNSLVLAAGWWAIQRNVCWGAALFWLAIGTTLHTLIDIPTHSSDGPLIFFPLNWHYRFPSPVSYWETENYGWTFLVFEYTLDLLLLGYFGRRWWRKRR